MTRNQPLFSIEISHNDVSIHRWWRHSYYRSPSGQKVDVQYSKTKSHSERLAREFANEPVLGFDMEWPWDADKRPKLQDKVALIQLASEKKVALFHIALHEGETVDDLIAPSLKEIIESSKIVKVGVAIMNADFRRLRTCFNLEPKGAFELSHLHNLITYGTVTPRLVTTKLRSLSTQVEQHLGLPLWKGNVRTSNWSQPLNWNQTQYAATDAYACFMLFHCMNSKRLAMDPVPPLPQLAEAYLTSTMPKSTTLQLESLKEDGEVRIITAVDFFRPIKDEDQDDKSAEGVAGDNNDTDSGPKTIENTQGETGDRDKNDVGVSSKTGRETISKHSKPGSNQSRKQTKDRKVKDAKPAKSGSAGTLMDSSCWSLYAKLASHRKETARSQGISAFIIAHNTVLQALTIHRPSNERELLLVPGVGKVKGAHYGAAWLEIIANFEKEQKKDDNDNKQQQQVGDEAGGGGLYPELVEPDPKRRRIVCIDRSEEVSIPSNEPPAILSTGLSFQFEQTSLGHEPSTPPRPRKQDDSDSDDESVFGPPMKLPRPSALKRKREIAEPSNLERQSSLFQSAMLTEASQPEPVFSVKLEPDIEMSLTNNEMKRPGASTSPLVPAPTPTVVRQSLQTPAGGFGWEKTILRKKLEAYIKGVVSAMQLKPNEPLLSEGMLHYLIDTVPRTIEEFRRAPGMHRLMKACETVKMDVWRAFEKWTRNDT